MNADVIVIHNFNVPKVTLIQVDFLKFSEVIFIQELTRKQILFTCFYIVTSNGAKSARLAGYSARDARRQANRLLKNKGVSVYLNWQSRRIQNYPKPVPSRVELNQLLFAHGIKKMLGKRIIPRHHWLTYREMLFGEYYVTTGADGAAAAKKAGYTNNPKQQAYRLYRNNGVRVYLNWSVNRAIHEANLFDLKLWLWKYGFDVHDLDLALIQGTTIQDIKHQIKRGEWIDS